MFVHDRSAAGTEATPCGTGRLLAVAGTKRETISTTRCSCADFTYQLLLSVTQRLSTRPSLSASLYLAEFGVGITYTAASLIAPGARPPE